MESAKVVGRACLFLALGLLWSVDARAAAPAGRYVVAVETVFDQSTGLLWQRQDSPQQFGQSGSNAYCQGLTLAGHADWRLPTIKELQSLLDVRGTTPLDPVFGIRGDRYWSSSPSGFRFWAMNYGSSRWTDSISSGNNLPVRCVR